MEILGKISNNLQREIKGFNSIFLFLNINNTLPSLNPAINLPIKFLGTKTNLITMKF